MNRLMGMGVIGWLTAFAVGFVVGGLLFISMKLQVEYVVQKRGPLWLMPVALYARILLLGVVFVLVAKLVPGEKVAATMLSGVVGVMLARVLVARVVRIGPGPQENGNREDGDRG